MDHEGGDWTSANNRNLSIVAETFLDKECNRDVMTTRPGTKNFFPIIISEEVNPGLHSLTAWQARVTLAKL